MIPHIQIQTFSHIWSGGKNGRLPTPKSGIIPDRREIFKFWL